MRPEDLVAFALTLPETMDEEPYGPRRPVFKVGGSIFAMLAAATPAEELTGMIAHAWECVVAGLPPATSDRLHRLRPGRR